MECSAVEFKTWTINKKQVHSETSELWFYVRTKKAFSVKINYEILWGVSGRSEA